MRSKLINWLDRCEETLALAWELNLPAIVYGNSDVVDVAMDVIDSIEWSRKRIELEDLLPRARRIAEEAGKQVAAYNSSVR